MLIRNFFRFLEVSTLTLSVLMIFWITASWVEVVSKNLGPAPAYHDWNFFSLVLDWAIYFR